MRIQAPFFLLLALAFSASAQTLTDPQASKRTRALFLNLQQIGRNNQLLFGHQDDLAYGVEWRASDSLNGSDVHAVCGDYPAVYGWELGHLERDERNNIDRVPFDRMKRWIKEGYARGGVITLSWHLDNYHTGGDAWDTTAAVRDILPGGWKHEKFKADLDRFAGFVADLRVGRGAHRHYVPILFRPFHELTGGWFWWGEPHTTPEDFKALWRFTVTYLRDVKKLHNLLYVYNTSEDYATAADYLRSYPGDEWVDVMSMDDYGDMRDSFGELRLRERLHTLVEVAESRGKVSAIAETGLESVPRADWWTHVLLKNIQADPVGRRIAYVLVWRNDNSKHHFAPYPKHSCSPDFMNFYNDPATLFEHDLPDLYKMPKRKKVGQGKMTIGN